MAEEEGLIPVAQTHFEKSRDEFGRTQENMARQRRESMRALRKFRPFADKGSIGAKGGPFAYFKNRKAKVIGEKGSKSFLDYVREDGFVSGFGNWRKGMKATEEPVKKEEPVTGSLVTHTVVTPPGSGSTTATTVSPSGPKTLGLGIKVKGVD